jgi:hypothetical protein
LYISAAYLLGALFRGSLIGTILTGFFEILSVLKLFLSPNCFMKRLLILFTTLPFLAPAQDCKLKKEIDRFSQQPKLSTGFMNLSSTSGPVSLNIEADSKEVKLLFSLGDGNCFDNQSTASFSFDSTRTKTNQKNATAMNCDGIFTIIFRNVPTTPSALQKITLQTISTIALTDNTKKKIEINLKDEEKQLLLKKAACLVNEAKTLIKP